MQNHDLVIIGAGPAGMAAATVAFENGINDIIMIDRGEGPGGILRQCVHSGFGLKRFGKEMSGPEYAAAYEEKIKEIGITLYSSSMVMSMTNDKVISFQNKNGYFNIRAKAVILAMGCRERTRGALNIPGSRPAGVYTAGIAQKLVNCEGYSLGKRVVILGSGDIGLIMSERLSLVGSKVLAVCELMPYSNGLQKNIDKCLKPFNTPLLLSHTVTQIHGKKRLEGVTIAKVDENRQPISGTEQFLDCDTLLLSVGLIPENELTAQAGIPISPVTKGPIVDQFRHTLVSGIFACGNVLHVHDLVDYVTDESELAGKSAAEYIKSGKFGNSFVPTEAGSGISYVIPHRICTDLKRDTTLLFRVPAPAENININITSNGKTVLSEHRDSVRPGKMEKITIKGSEITKLSDTLTISQEQL